MTWPEQGSEMLGQLQAGKEIVAGEVARTGEGYKSGLSR
jgi:hypothetical protein